MQAIHHIEVIPESTNGGKFYVIADVHGEVETLHSVLARLKPEDTLIIAGDLIDRGESDENTPTSKEVLKLLMEYTQAPAGTKPKIHCIKGNHEIYFLNMLKRLKPNLPIADKKLLLKDLITFVKNGGSWLFQRDPNNPDEINRYQWFRAHSCGLKTPECQLEVARYLWKIINSPAPLAAIDPEVFTFQTYIEALPFVIKVEGEHPALIVHADLPFSDEEIDERILHQTTFTDLEIQKLTDVRVANLATEGKRDHSSHLVIVGHNIIDEPGDTSIPHPALPVRPETNQINLDGGAYFTKGFLLFNLSDNTIEVIGNHISSEGQALLTYACDAIQTHLDDKAYEAAHSTKRRRI